MQIDLNCDVGEGCANDAELLDLVSSANIACGAHAGSAEIMKRTVDLALERGVSVGAHPGYRDRDNFGRIPQDLSSDEIIELVTDQVAGLSEIMSSAGGRLSHVKPHGALYNQAAADPAIADAVAAAVAQFDQELVLFGLSGSASIAAAKGRGLRTASEVFADRTYQSDGSLTPRSAGNAPIDSTDTSINQVLDMIKYGRVRSVDAIMVAIKAETVCIHGDGENAVEFARAIRSALAENNVIVRAING